MKNNKNESSAAANRFKSASANRGSGKPSAHGSTNNTVDAAEKASQGKKINADSTDRSYSPTDGPIQYPMRGTIGAGDTPARHGRANVIGTPGNAMTHDEVVGGGHTIEVQKEVGDQITDFAVPAQDTESKGFTRSENTSISPLRDNFGVVPPLSNSVFGNSSVTSVYGNTDTSRRVYGDFGATGEEKAAEESEKRATRGRNPDYGCDEKPKKSSEKVDCGCDEKPKKSSEKVDCGCDEKPPKSSEKSDCGCDEKDRAVTVKSGEKLIKTIVIAGQIEGHTQLPQEQKATRYEELIPQLVEVEENDEIGGLLLILNTVGGDVEAGLALSELIAGMKKPTASLVLGGGHSIGVPLAVSAKRSFIVPSATMTLHPVRVTGLVLSAPQTYVYLSNMQERIIDFVCSHSRISSERFYELMLAREEMSTDLGSVLDGKKAVEEGIIDSLGTLADAIRFLKSADSN